MIKKTCSFQLGVLYKIDMRIITAGNLILELSEINTFKPRETTVSFILLIKKDLKETIVAPWDSDLFSETIIVIFAKRVTGNYAYTPLIII